MPNESFEDAQVERLIVEQFGMSSAELERELSVELEHATTEERTEFFQLVDQANDVFPKLNATVDRIETRLVRARTTMEELCRSVSALNERVAGIEGALVSAFPLTARPSNESIQ